MYLYELKIWNFRKYGESVEDKECLVVNFNNGLNLVVGENDSGKTAIIDAIKIVLGTQSLDNIRIEENDFYKREDGTRCDMLKIECTFECLSDIESGRFLEWIELKDDGSSFLKVRVIARRKNNKILLRKTGGEENVDITFDASEYLRVTYLKPLRDAENELSPGYKSRFAQILKNHPVFKQDSKENPNELVKIVGKANKEIEEFFKIEEVDRSSDGIDFEKPSSILSEIKNTLSNFLGSDNKGYNTSISISKMELPKILSRLLLSLDDNKVGLGTLNQLYMAMELLLLEVKEQNDEFGLALIEEIEAHIHPQAQLRVIKHLEDNVKSQMILTTHSITLASVVKLDNLIICKNNNAYSLNSKYTDLSKGDYEFLERFLDSTKANLFFAKGVIFVEGDAESILIPTIAEIIDKPLYKYGVSIVNVGNVAFLRYSNIFIRKDRQGTIGIPTSIITDLDVRPIEYYKDKGKNVEEKQYKYTSYKISSDGKRFVKKDSAKEYLRKNLQKLKLSKETYEENIETIEDDYNIYKEIIKKDKEYKYNFRDIKVFMNNWTLEYDLALSCIKQYLYAAVQIAEEIRKSEGILINLEIDKYIAQSKDDLESFKLVYDTDTEIAYEIYKPLLNNNASKAVCAQYLSKILIRKVKEEPGLKEEMLHDIYLKYIIDAIENVTVGKTVGDIYE